MSARRGHRKWREKATETGAFDSVGGHLGNALDGARLVILDTPAGETRELMEAIGPVLEEDCRVTNTALSMVQSLEWADAYFREDTTFVAGRPLVRTPSADLDAADGGYSKARTTASFPPRQLDRTRSGPSWASWSRWGLIRCFSIPTSTTPIPPR